nr:MAG TPA_asm: hypothetical protein [Caudoviricetes sp.]
MCAVCFTPAAPGILGYSSSYESVARITPSDHNQP